MKKRKALKKPNEFKQHIAGVFSRASSTYGQIGPDFFTCSGKQLVKFANIKPGSQVLDVACGRGAVLFPGLLAVSETGQVIGVDLAAGMVEHTSKEINRRKIKNAQVVKMDAENLEFPEASFDYVLCGLSLFFFPRLEKALAEMYRVIKPGGTLAASTFQKREKDEPDEITEKWSALYAAFKDKLKPIPSMETQHLDSETKINQAFAKAGFVQIEVMAEENTCFYQDAEEWWETSWSHGYRNYLERLDVAALASFKEQAQKIIVLQQTERGIPEPWNLFFMKGQKPHAIAT